MKVQAGQSYDIELDFEYLRSDAQLNFDLGFKREVDIQKSVEQVKEADIVIFASGISPSLEGEEMGVNLPGFKKGDRTDIELPAVQRELIDALHRAGKKIVLVNCSGSPSDWNLKLRNVKPFCRLGIRDNKVEQQLPKCCLAIIIRRVDYR